jgi:hypothetical protein
MINNVEPFVEVMVLTLQVQLKGYSVSPAHAKTDKPQFTFVTRMELMSRYALTTNPQDAALLIATNKFALK